MRLFHHVFLWWFLISMLMMPSPESSWAGLCLAPFWAPSILPCLGQTCSQSLWIDPFYEWDSEDEETGESGSSSLGMNDYKYCDLFSMNLPPKPWGVWAKAPRERIPAHAQLWLASQETLPQHFTPPARILAGPGLIRTSPGISYLSIP